MTEYNKKGSWLSPPKKKPKKKKPSGIQRVVSEETLSKLPSKKVMLQRAKLVKAEIKRDAEIRKTDKKKKLGVKGVRKSKKIAKF